MLGKFKQSVVRTLYPYGSTRLVHRGPLKGMRYQIQLGMGFTYAWNIGGESWLAMRDLVSLGQVAYDIGANRGQSTLHLAQAVGSRGRVVAFEPVPENFEILKANLALNSLDHVIPVHAAIAEQDGMCEFLFTDASPTVGRLTGSEAAANLATAPAIAVQTYRLDDYQQHGWPHPQFMKIDVEGGAKSVLAGANELIRVSRPVILIESHSQEERGAIRDLLQDHNYQAHTLDGVQVTDPTQVDSDPLICRPVTLS